jgi:hypothetical protein
MNNVLLGQIEVQASPVYSTTGSSSYQATTGPVDSSNTSTMPITLPVEGGVLYDLPLERLDVPTVPPPTEDKNDTGTGNKKNLLLFGIGGLVLAYLLFRKK